jgi:UDP-2,3-diacylglucosamine hydrolase
VKSLAKIQIQQIDNFILPDQKKAYFASDLHLGLYPYDKSSLRERVFVRWLDQIKDDVGALFLVGDIFDFWYEYRKVTSRGFVRFLGKLCEITDRGIPVFYFTGNHDVWVFDYLPTETGVKVFYNAVEIEINHHKFVVGHGDGLGSGDLGYKLLRKAFYSKFLQFLFSRLHPNFAYYLGHTWSKQSRLSKGVFEPFLGLEKEHQILFAREYLKQKQADYFVFGHRHIPMDIKLNGNSRLINLGEWIINNTYAVFDGQNMELLSFHDKNEEKKVNIIKM